MKKIVLLLTAVAFFTAAKAQFVVGLQGGYYWQKNSTSVSDDYTTSNNMVGCLQIGYKITPRLYVGVMGGYISASSDTLITKDLHHWTQEESPMYAGMTTDITDHMKSYSRTGWMVAPQVKYEFLRFGNMHFNLLLQGTLRMLGQVDFKESFTTVTVPNPNEYRELEPTNLPIEYMSWGVSLRPTLVYEFSPHLSAELMLDLLSVGYINETETIDPKLPSADKIKSTRAIFYGGINSFTEVLRWENTLLKLGFNWTF